MPEVMFLDLRLRQRNVFGFMLGMAAYALLIVVLYPSFRDDSSLNQLTAGNPKLAALFGASGSLTSPDGWMNGNLYANFLPLLALLMTIGYGAATIAGQQEEGVLGSIASLPMNRRRLLVEKVGALAVLALPVPTVTALVALAGRFFDLPLAAGPLRQVTVAAALMAFDLGLVALAVGCWTGSRGAALAVASLVASVAYLISSMAPVVSGIHAVRYLSPIYWSVGEDQLSIGVSVLQIALLVTAAVAVTFVAWLGLRRLDII